MAPTESINQTIQVKATVVSPVSVGQGSEKEWVEGVDYLWDDGYLYHLNLEMISKAGIPLHQFSALIANKDINGLKRLLLPKLDDVYDFGMEMPISSPNPVKTFYFNPLTEKYILFGSSLKGAIRSNLFHFLSEKEQKTSLLGQREKLNEYIFGKMKDGTDFMRFIRIGDLSFEDTVLINTKIYNLHSDGGQWKGGWKHQTGLTDERFNPKGFNTIYECLPAGASAEGFIRLSPLLYDLVPNQPNKESKDSIIKGSSDLSAQTVLFNAINICTLQHLKKESAFFKEYPEGEHSEDISSELDRLKKLVSDFINSGSNECMVRLSAGSGFHSVTGDWQFDNHIDTGFYTGGRNNGKKRYKSRRIACYKGHFSPMGFLRLSAL